LPGPGPERLTGASAIRTPGFCSFDSWTAFPVAVDRVRAAHRVEAGDKTLDPRPISPLARELQSRRRRRTREMEIAEDLHSRLAAAESRVAELEAENAAQGARIRELRDQNANLQALTAASRLLAASPQRDNVLSAISDIVVGMIGAREVAIFEIDHVREALTLARAQGMDATSRCLIDAMPALDGVMHSGEALVLDRRAAGAFGGLTVAVPLKLEDCVTGVVAIFRLATEKPELEPVDHALLEVLSSQAAIALHSVAYKSLRPTVRPPPPRRRATGDEEIT
jgi:hypothetical protein